MKDSKTVKILGWGNYNVSAKKFNYGYPFLKK